MTSLVEASKNIRLVVQKTRKDQKIEKSQALRMTILWVFEKKHLRQVSVDGAKRHQRHCLNSVRTDSYSRTLIPKLFILRYR
jgi:hypothetical protein